MSVPSLDKIIQGEGQDRNVFNNFKRLVKSLGQLTNEQLALIHFEVWHEARLRAAAIEEYENTPH